jgi:hypothetical protein
VRAWILPIINQDLFEKVQEQLKRDHIMRESKEFAFTKLIHCGLCGSGITADEKYKKLKDGTVNRYVYYGCTRSRDLHCKGGYVREEELIQQLIKLLDKMDVNEFGIKKKFQDEVERYKRFKRMVLGIDKLEQKITKEVSDIDFKMYARYLLQEGTMIEKRELLSNFKSWLKLKNKQLVIEEKSE